jgi:hypothetical protein
MIAVCERPTLASLKNVYEASRVGGLSPGIARGNNAKNRLRRWEADFCKSLLLNDLQSGDWARTGDVQQAVEHCHA